MESILNTVSLRIGLNLLDDVERQCRIACPSDHIRLHNAFNRSADIDLIEDFSYEGIGIETAVWEWK